MKESTDQQPVQPGSWTWEDSKTICIRWEIPTAPFKTSVAWRGIPIHIRIHAYKHEYGWTRMVAFVHNHRLYQDKFTKYKWSGGHHGDYPPEISTPTHKLKIRALGGVLLLEDELRKAVSRDMHEETNKLFEIIDTPVDLNFGPLHPSQEKKKVPAKPAPVIKKEELPLYEHKSDKGHLQSLVYFNDEDLVVDRWVLTDNYEDEKFCTVSERDLPSLYKYFRIDDKNRAALLIAIANGFRGKEAFRNFTNFLDDNEIPYSLRRG